MLYLRDESSAPEATAKATASSATATIQVYGKETDVAGVPVDVRIDWSVNGSAWRNVNALPSVFGYEMTTGDPGFTETINLGTASAGEVVIRAHAYYFGSWHTFDSNGSNFVVLNNGDDLFAALESRGFTDGPDADSIPDVLTSPYGQGANLACCLALFLSPPGVNVNLWSPGSVLLIGELGSVNPQANAFDLQDLVILTY